MLVLVTGCNSSALSRSFIFALEASPVKVIELVHSLRYLWRSQRAQPSTTGKKIWLSMHPGNLVLRKSSVGTYVRPPLLVNRG